MALDRREHRLVELGVASTQLAGCDGPVEDGQDELQVAPVVESEL